MTATAGRQLSAKLFQLLQVGSADLRGVNQLPAISCFQRRELRPLAKGEIQFVGVPNLENDHVVFGVPKVRESFQQMMTSMPRR